VIISKVGVENPRFFKRWMYTSEATKGKYPVGEFLFAFLKGSYNQFFDQIVTFFLS
jgi:hypothetical protein